ncbi:NUMOD1 domain-containing DNA-binding protein [Bifidobacterium biavatii]|uniref:Nuclease-associated modular DNA-binding 1 domain-containing protein n=1 Tax=Bifidobacterium biavatii DSM 23969 TaxID=1437608 RepID=A0A086ZXG4_9BIFI|nr:NUMOD1 domain-containing DNA-binding protein [Bifidobacterium biavatii]KFI51214.1 hypothetical protein BBIA_0778 [Bifidobacterium biavatii DSM 23969]
MLYMHDPDGTIGQFRGIRKAVAWLAEHGHPDATFANLQQALRDGTAYCGRTWTTLKNPDDTGGAGIIVEQIDPKTLKVEAVYDGYPAAARAVGVLPESIGTACSRQIPAGGWLWRRRGDERPLRKWTKRIGHERGICRLDRDGTVLQRYESVKDAAQAVGIAYPNSIIQAIDAGRPVGGYWWKYADKRTPVLRDKRLKLMRLEQCDAHTGEVVGEHRSAQAAARSLDVGLSVVTVAARIRAAARAGNPAFGYRWRILHESGDGLRASD